VQQFTDEMAHVIVKQLIVATGNGKRKPRNESVVSEQKKVMKKKKQRKFIVAPEILTISHGQCF
jgi:hypothetical protein